MMLITSFISSRIGARLTLLIGLALIVLFALLAALSGSVEAVIGFRAGWGLGNALFISTALATIVGAASGGSSSAIILYEAALGLGIAIGPLLGGLLGTISWRGPFFGVATLMAIAFIAILIMLPREPKGVVRTPTKLSAPITALKNPALRTARDRGRLLQHRVLHAARLHPLRTRAAGSPRSASGLTFFGWGLAVAVTSVWVAPLLTARMRRTTVLATVLPLLAHRVGDRRRVRRRHRGARSPASSSAVCCSACSTPSSPSRVMEATDLPRSVASSSYSAVRFLGGAAAPPLATALADRRHGRAPLLSSAAASVAARGGADLRRASRAA